MTYVALGYVPDGSWEGFDVVPLAVSRDKVKLDALVEASKNPNPDRDKGGKPLFWGAFNEYVHEGKPYHHIDVVGPVPDLDGPRVVVAGTVGTINM